MRPLSRSYGVISTLTLSPTKILIRFFFIFPDACARILCPFSSSTLNIVLGKTSNTEPLNSTKSSFDISNKNISSRYNDITNWMFLLSYCVIFSASSFVIVFASSNASFIACLKYFLQSSLPICFAFSSSICNAS